MRFNGSYIMHKITNFSFMKRVPPTSVSCMETSRKSQNSQQNATIDLQQTHCMRLAFRESQ